MMIYQSQYVPFLRLLAGVPIVDADHTPHFQSLAHYLLKCFGEQGLLNDMSKDEINLAATLSVYHDIGKSMLRPTLLYKTGPLSKAEQEQVKSHTEWGEFLIDLTIPAEPQHIGLPAKSAAITMSGGMAADIRMGCGETKFPGTSRSSPWLTATMHWSRPVATSRLFPTEKRPA